MTAIVTADIVIIFMLGLTGLGAMYIVCTRVLAVDEELVEKMLAGAILMAAYILLGYVLITTCVIG